MIESKEVIINDKKFYITQFMAREGLKLQFRLVKQVGPIIASAASSLVSDEIDVMSIVRALSQKIDEEACFSLVIDLLKTTKYKGQDLRDTDFDLAFAADYKTLYELLYQVIDYNYGNFFGVGGIGSLFNKSLPTTEASDMKNL